MECVEEVWRTQMRWKEKQKKKVVVGDRRLTKKFLLFPRSVGGESRWLERATIEQECVGRLEEINDPSCDHMHEHGCNKVVVNVMEWYDIRWVD